MKSLLRERSALGAAAEPEVVASPISAILSNLSCVGADGGVCNGTVGDTSLDAPPNPKKPCFFGDVMAAGTGSGSPAAGSSGCDPTVAL